MEPAGPDCIIPGLQKPIRVLGLQVRSSSLTVTFEMRVTSSACFLVPVNVSGRTKSKG